MPSGLPRNDILLTGDQTAIRDKVCKLLHISQTSMIVLYAPTFRGDLNVIGGSVSEKTVDLDIDIQNVIHLIENKYHNDVVVLFRKHHALKTYNNGGHTHFRLFIDDLGFLTYKKTMLPLLPRPRLLHERRQRHIYPHRDMARHTLPHQRGA